MQATLATSGWKAPQEEDLLRLCAQEGPCVTIYLAPHRQGGQSAAASTQLRVLLKDLVTEAAQRGMIETDRIALFQPLHEIEAAPEFEAGHGDGLVLFRSPRLCEQFRLPGGASERATLAGHLDIIPLLEYLSNRIEFFLLAIAKKRIRLLQVGRETYKDLNLAKLGIATDFEQFLAFDQPDHRLQNRSRPAGGNRSVGATFGTGSDEERQYRRFHDYCKAIDRAIRPTLDLAEWPLLVVGTDSDAAAYRQASTYKKILERPLTASPDGGWSDLELVAHGRQTVSQQSLPGLGRALALYGKAGVSRKLTETNAIVEAAAGGRILELFIAEGSRIPGEYAALAGRLLPAGAIRIDTEDLANAAAVDTIRHGGSARLLAAAGMPENGALAALLRY